MFKTANVGTADRGVRIVVGLILVLAPYLTSWALWSNPLWRWLLPIIGLVLLLTAIVRFCPLYRLIGVNTCRLD